MLSKSALRTAQMSRRLFDALIYSQGPAAVAAGKRGGEAETTKLFDHFKRRGLTRKRLGEEEKKKKKPDYSGCGGSGSDDSALRRA